MGEFYPTSMSRWLAKQVELDYYWDKCSGHEEKLMYGLYFTTHTVESLSNELGYAFKIKECLIKDPRYIICIVEPKDNLDSLADPEYSQEWRKGNVSDYAKLGLDLIDGILDQIESICNFLESHERNMLQYYEDKAPKGKSPLQGMPLDVSEFLSLLKTVFSSLPGFNTLP